MPLPHAGAAEELRIDELRAEELRADDATGVDDRAEDTGICEHEQRMHACPAGQATPSSHCSAPAFTLSPQVV